MAQLPNISELLSVDEYIQLPNERVEDEEEDIFESIVDRYSADTEDIIEELEEGEIEEEKVLIADAIKALETLKLFEINVGHLELLSMEFLWNQSSGTFQPNIYMEWNHPLLGLWFHGKFHGILPTSLSIKPTTTTNLTALVSIELIYMYFFL
jgi:hypothetical protein